MIPAGLGHENDCGAEDPSSHQRGCYIRTITKSVQLEKNTGREPQGAYRQDELIGGKPPVRIVTLTLTHDL
jgi:hypothetical protein